MEKKRKGRPSAASGGGIDDIHTAARNGDLATVQSICLNNPLSVNSRDKHSRTPLHLAAWAGQVEVVSYLCKNKADVGAAAMDDMGAIHFAAQKGHLEVVRTLVASGVSIRSTNRKGLTPLHYAVQGSHLELAKYLVKKCADLNCKNKSGKTPLDLANNEETRLLLVEFESNLKNADDFRMSNEDADAVHEKKIVPPEEVFDQSAMEKAEADNTGVEEENKLSFPERKKPKVALTHLLAEDDTEDYA